MITATLIGLLLYSGLMFWFGTGSRKKMAMLISLPAVLGLCLYQLSHESRPGDTFIFRHFEALAAAQLLAGFVAFLLGKYWTRASRKMKKDLQA